MNFNDFGIDSASLAGSLEARLAAAKQADFSQIMISAEDIAGHPVSADAAIAAIRASGLRMTGLEALRDFEGLSGKMHEYKVDIAKSMLKLCARLQSRLLLTEATSLTHVDNAPEAIARDLRKLGMLATPLGIKIAYKGIAASRTARDFREAAEVVARANCPNVGLSIDAYDIISAAMPLDELEPIYAPMIFLVQLSDFMVQDTRDKGVPASEAYFRVFPGEGAHSELVAKIVIRLEEIGYFGDYSFDVYNSDYLQLPPAEIARRARCSADWLGESVLRRTLPVPNLARLHATAQRI